MSDLSRAALIDAAAKAIHARMCGSPGSCGGPAPYELRDATLAVDAVLPLIADAIETSDIHMAAHSCNWDYGPNTKSKAARLVRSYTQEQK